MKKTFNFLFAAFGITAAFSCNKNEISEATMPQAKLIPAVISAGAESTDTKTYVDAKQVLWQAGDDILVYAEAGAAGQNFTLESGEGSTNATFAGSLPEGANSVYAVYPASAAEGLGQDNILTLSLPSQQQLGANNAAQGALVAVAAGTKSSGLSFKNVFGLVKVTLTADNVKAIVVDGTNVAGQVKVNASTGVVTEVVSGLGSVTLTPADGCFAPGSYYVAVLPGTTAADLFTVSVVIDGSDIDGVPSAKTATLAKEISVPRNGGFKFSDTASALSEVYAISNAAEFTAWNDGTKSMSAVLTADIDMSGVEWTPAAMTRVLDGKGHCVYNYVKSQATSVALFSSISANATLKNLTLGSSDGKTYDGVSTITVSNSAAADNFTYAAGLVAYISGKAVIENCRNFAKVVSDENNVTKIRLGGIAGGAGNYASTITNCVNAGEIVALSGETPLSANSNIGGIVAWSDGPLTISNTVNSGYIHTNNKLINRLCGILGGTAKAVTLDNCDNSGVVKYGVANTTEVFVSGIIGDLNNSDAVVKNCDNTGAVSIEDKTAKSSAVVELAGVCSKLWLAGEFSGNTNNAEITSSVINSVNNETSGIIAGGVVANIAPVAETSVVISNCSTLKNSNVRDIYSYDANLDSKNTTKYIKLGGIAAQMSGAGSVSFDSCSNAGLVQKITTDFGIAYLGGIVGFINSGSAVSFTSCTNTRWVGTTKTALGTSDISTKKGGMIFIGGICGNMKVDASFTSCVNTGGIGQEGNVDAMYGQYVYFGGIVGNSTAPMTISKCSNSGSVINKGKVLYWSSSKWTNQSNGLRIGGIVGAFNPGAGKTGTISDCTNTGLVSNESKNAKATQELGGILGYCSGGSVTIENCISNATIKSLNGTLANIYSGAITGYVSGGAVTANNNGVAGKLIKTDGAETAITAENYASCLWILADGKTVTTATPNYFYTGTKGLQIASFASENDANNW